MDIAVRYASFLAVLLILSLQLHHCYGDSSSISCKEDERVALLQFKGGLKDSDGQLSTSWVGRNCCSWQGIECNNVTGHVTRLDLNELGVEGDEITPSLTALHELSYLDLSRNNFTGASIPKFIVTFTGLSHLDLSNSNFAGSVPSELGRLSSLRYLDLSGNELNGTLLFLGQLDGLVELHLGDNNFEDVVTNAHFENLTRLEVLNISSNRLRVKIGPEPICPCHHLRYINLGNCIVGPSFPSWLQKMSNLSVIRMFNAGISDVLPNWFWKFASSSLTSVDLSDNMIRGKLPSSFAHLTELWYLNMRNNQLEGPFPEISSHLRYLILNNNSISGSIPSNVGDAYLVVLFVSSNKLNGSIPTWPCKMLEFSILDLSHNQLSGEIPDCLGNSLSLQTIDFSNNNLSGGIPASIGTLLYLESLHLEYNNLSVGLPLALMNSTSLKTLDLGNNKLSGNIPSTFQLNTSLRTLNLRSNIFIGEIPSGLGNLPYLKVIDLSQNLFSGSIPQTFGNLSAMKSSYGNKDENDHIVLPFDNSYEVYKSIRVITKGRYEEYGKLLKWWVSIDLSSNNLSGAIPQGLATLSRLQNLNLSRNHLTGTVPRNVTGLQNLESLDLSYNNLTGKIPQSMTELNSLGVMNFSFNNLSGRIPTGGSFQSHPDASIYLGNSYLCGFPLTSPCGGTVPSETPPQGTKSSQDKGDEIWFYLSMAPGFVIGFWAFVGALLLKEKWRIAYYGYIDRGYDKVYVFVAIKLANMRRP